jgi:hypothetical protein
MRLAARDADGNLLATASVVLPVSDEMACSTCHSSTSENWSAMPQAGWANNDDPAKDYKLNILALHDEKNGTSLAASQPVLCASCHATNALGTKGVEGVLPLTAAVHTRHAGVYDTALNLTLADSNNREACYRCHPGSVTKCLRGAMGNAGMQCQNCHGSMWAVGAATRKGWLDEPGCQNCHTGTAVRYSEGIRMKDVFDAGGAPRQAADARFSVEEGKLYRQSAGHGGLACEACHGSTHAEYPSSHDNDNAQIVSLQGHTGVLSECTACHGAAPSGLTGPHNMHEIGSGFIRNHQSLARRGTTACKDCHGADYRGTVLSATLANRTFNANGIKEWRRGPVVGCYSCHNGPNP